MKSMMTACVYVRLFHLHNSKIHTLLISVTFHMNQLFTAQSDTTDCDPYLTLFYLNKDTKKSFTSGFPVHICQGCYVIAWVSRWLLLHSVEIIGNMKMSIFCHTWLFLSALNRSNQRTTELYKLKQLWWETQLKGL